MSSSSSTLSSTAATQLGNTLWAKQPKANAELFALTYGALVAELVRDLEQTDKIVQELDRMGHSMGIRCIEEVLAKAAGVAAATTSSTTTSTATTSTQGDTGAAAAAAALSVQSFEDTKHVVKVAFRMFWGLVVDIGSGSANTAVDSSNPTMMATTTTTDTAGAGAAAATTTSSSYTIRFTDNPLTIFVELPADRQDLEYSQLFAGMVRGMLEMLQYDCQVSIVTSPLSSSSSSAAASSSTTGTTSPPPPSSSNVTEIAVTLQQVLQAGAGEEYQEE